MNENKAVGRALAEKADMLKMIHDVRVDFDSRWSHYDEACVGRHSDLLNADIEHVRGELEDLEWFVRSRLLMFALKVCPPPVDPEDLTSTEKGLRV